jgi:carbon monoxide dehydrogenase subunit G
MEFTNTFDVQAPLQVVWDFMLDALEVAPCVPGAQITDTVDERHFKGMMKIKLGAVQMTYRGDLEMDPDEGSRVITLRAKGSEVRGSGGAAGTVTTHVSEASNGMTHVEIHSKIDVTGRVAQFGRGIMQDVSNRLIKEFAKCLESKLQARLIPVDSAGVQGQAKAGAPATEVEIARETKPSSPPPEPAAATGDAEARRDTSAAVASPQRTASPPAELRLQNLIFDITRTRLAAGLRKLASLIEPK